MDKKQLFDQYRSRLVAQGVLKALICGLIVGFAAGFVAAFAAWFVGYVGGTWLSVGICVGITVVGGVVFYFAKFRPTEQEIARRVDRLGLDERIITMLELENDESYIAVRQREDAKSKMSDVTPKRLKFRVAKKLVACAIAAAIIAPSMMVVCELAARNVIRSGLELINPDANGDKTILLCYEATEGGSIDGEEEQILYAGDTPTPVKALAEDGWMFVEWSDGDGNPYRADKEVTEDVVYTAVFEEIDPDGESDDQDGNNDGDGDNSNDQPGEPKSDGGDGDGEGDGNKDPGDKPNDSSGGKYEDKNQIIDGETPYRDELDSYREEAMEILASGDDIPDDLREIIEKYFGGL